MRIIDNLHDFLNLIKSNEEIVGCCIRRFTIKQFFITNLKFKNCYFEDILLEYSGTIQCSFENCSFRKCRGYNSLFYSIYFNRILIAGNAFVQSKFENIQNQSDKKNIIRKNTYINSTFCDCTFSNIDISNNEFEGCFFRRMTSSKDYESILKAKLHLCMGLYLNCPEEGSFIGYKKIIYLDKDAPLEVEDKGILVKLLITEDAKRSSGYGRKCRASKAKVLSMTDINTGKEVSVGCSMHDPDFIYKTGEIVEVNNFNNDRWNECSSGIHFFITKQEALDYESY